MFMACSNGDRDELIVGNGRTDRRLRTGDCAEPLQLGTNRRPGMMGTSDSDQPLQLGTGKSPGMATKEPVLDHVN